MKTLKYQKLSKFAFDPERAHRGDSGIDVFSPKDYVVKGREDILIPLDLRFEIKEGFDLSVYNKSGVSTKKKLFKGAELIDFPYRGNCHVHLFNFSDKDVEIKRGDKIAQLVLRPVILCDLIEGEISIDTDRGEGGFGSTGDKK